MTISAKVIAHSTSKECPDLYTLELEYPRFGHQELMTHRVFSRNASSSRAMSIEKNLQEIQRNPAMPIHWGLNEKGMQADSEIPDKEHAKALWTIGMQKAVSVAAQLSDVYKLHKQVVNRVVEPFSHIRVIVTSTEWDNFFALRWHRDAQPELQELARVMKIAMAESEPDYLLPGFDWHLPYVDEDELAQYDEDTCRKISVARCARVSYKPSTNYSIDKDIDLFNRLKDAGHFSPFEHVATPMAPTIPGTWADPDVNVFSNPASWETGITHADREGVLWSGNFREWIQYRQILEGM